MLAAKSKFQLIMLLHIVCVLYTQQLLSLLSPQPGSMLLSACKCVPGPGASRYRAVGPGVWDFQATGCSQLGRLVEDCTTPLIHTYWDQADWRQHSSGLR